MKTAVKVAIKVTIFWKNIRQCHQNTKSTGGKWLQMNLQQKVQNGLEAS